MVSVLALLQLALHLTIKYLCDFTHIQAIFLHFCQLITTLLNLILSIVTIIFLQQFLRYLPNL
jgi:hypothetical protein